MKRSLLMTLTILLLLSIAVSVSAANTPDNPVNPHQEQVWAAERKLNIEFEKETVQAGYQNNLTLTQVTAPALNAAPKWKITPASGHGSITYLRVMLLMKDFSTDYTTVWWREYSSNNIPSNAETCVIVTSGEYLLIVTANYSDGTVGDFQLDFSIGGTSALTAKVAQIVSSCKKSSDWETALCLHDWLTHNMYYDSSLNYYGADGALLRGYGVCDSYSKAYFMLCQKAGIPVGRVTGTGNGGSHAWNVIQLNGKWYFVDPTWDDPLINNSSTNDVPVSGHERHDYFCLNEEILTLNHTIEGYVGEYGPCTSLEMNYLVVTGEWKKWSVYSSYTNDYLPVIDDIVTAFEYYGETTYIVDEKTPLECTITEFMTMCTPLSDANKKILKAALPLALADFKRSDGTVMDVIITQSPLTVTLLTNINEARLPGSLSIIESQSFYGIGADKVILPSGCWKIESQSFANSKVKIVVFPKNSAFTDSANIADDAFANCSGIIFVTTNKAAIKYAQSHGIMVRDK